MNYYHMNNEVNELYGSAGLESYAFREFSSSIV